MIGVDAEALVADVLRADADVAALVSDRVYTDLPAEPRYPCVLVRRIGGPTDSLGHLDAARLQVEAWSVHRDVARDLAAAALRAGLAMRGRYDDAVVTGASPLVGLTYLPDQVTAYPRFLFDLVVFCHPVPATA